MKKDTRLFFLASIFCAVFCIGIFVWGSLTMIRQGEQASMTLGEIYMKAMNFQMQLHFRSIIELKIKQVEGIVNKTPPEKNWDQHEKARQELRSSTAGIYASGPVRYRRHGRSHFRRTCCRHG